MKNTYKIKNLLNPSDPLDAINKQNLDNKMTDFDNNSTVRNNQNTHFNTNTLTGLYSIYLNKVITYPPEVWTKQYTDIQFNDQSIVKNNVHIDFNDKNLDIVRFVKVNSYPAVKSHLTCNEYIDNNINWSVDND